MPIKRDPLKRLTGDEEFEIALLDYEMRDLFEQLGGELCECGNVPTKGNRCWRCRADKRG